MGLAMTSCRQGSLRLGTYRAGERRLAMSIDLSGGSPGTLSVIALVDAAYSLTEFAVMRATYLGLPGDDPARRLGLVEYDPGAQALLFVRSLPVPGGDALGAAREDAALLGRLLPKLEAQAREVTRCLARFQDNPQWCAPEVWAPPCGEPRELARASSPFGGALRSPPVEVGEVPLDAYVVARLGDPSDLVLSPCHAVNRPQMAGMLALCASLPRLEGLHDLAYDYVCQRYGMVVPLWGRTVPEAVAAFREDREAAGLLAVLEEARRRCAEAGCLVGDGWERGRELRLCLGPDGIAAPA